MTPVVVPVILAPRVKRYGAVTMSLHWIIAALFLTQIGLGWWMNEYLPDHSPAQARIETLHISLGLTTMLFIIARIAVRITHRAPPLPAEMAGWERMLAHAGHFLFYLLMIALPLTGWAMTSLRAPPIHLWGFDWPKLPGLDFLTGPDKRPMRQLLQRTHTTFLVWIAVANIVLHVAGALKHQFDGHPVAWRMLPFGKPKTPMRAAG